MDLSLREMGAGDIGVSKRVRIMAEAFMGRLNTYVTAIDEDDREAFAAVIPSMSFPDPKSLVVREPISESVLSGSRPRAPKSCRICVSTSTRRAAVATWSCGSSDCA